MEANKRRKRGINARRLLWGVIVTLRTPTVSIVKNMTILSLNQHTAEATCIDAAQVRYKKVRGAKATAVQFPIEIVRKAHKSLPRGADYRTCVQCLIDGVVYTPSVGQLMYSQQLDTLLVEEKV